MVMIGDTRCGMSHAAIASAKLMDRRLNSPSAVALTLSSALDLIKRSDSHMLTDEAGTPRPTNGNKEVNYV